MISRKYLCKNYVMKHYNLPLMAGMLDRGRATRGAHPTFLRLMSKFSTLVMGKDVNFTLPFSIAQERRVKRIVGGVPHALNAIKPF